jgi:hypothetical protein
MKKAKTQLKALKEGFERPEEDRKIAFTDVDGVTHKGLYIKEEDMFFIGFGLTGDFRYAFDIHDWTYYEGTI